MLYSKGIVGLLVHNTLWTQMSNLLEVLYRPQRAGVL